MNQRAQVVALYKQLYHMGKEYPKGKEWFHTRLKAAFLKNKVGQTAKNATREDEKDPNKIGELIGRAQYVVKEIEALYSLRKYRAMKDRYYDDKP